MDGKHFSLITIAMIILLGIVGLGFMQMNTNNTLSTIANRLMVVEKHVQQETVKTTSTTATTEAGAPCKGDCDAGVVEYKDYKWDFSFKYPEDFKVTVVNNEAVNGRKDLRITSKPGMLFLPGGGPAKPTSTDFTEGIQFDIRQLTAEELHETDSPKWVATTNPLVSEFVDECDGVGCSARTFSVAANKKVYIINVNASQGYPSFNAEVMAIINSIKE